MFVFEDGDAASLKVGKQCEFCSVFRSTRGIWKENQTPRPAFCHRLGPERTGATFSSLPNVGSILSPPSEAVSGLRSSPREKRSVCFTSPDSTQNLLGPDLFCIRPPQLGADSHWGPAGRFIQQQTGCCVNTGDLKIKWKHLTGRLKGSDAPMNLRCY